MNDREYVQYIVVRKDLIEQMGVGKTSAQVAHASLGVLLYTHRDPLYIEIRLDDDEGIQSWLRGRFTKLVTYVKTKQKLLNLSERLDNLGIRTKLIYDSCFTVLAPEEPDGSTLTCMGVIPMRRQDVPKCLKKLRLLE
jgi:peptidyl-tRNA hydrolase